jgi:Pyruvate/2-oxoacid:ferredoxin oxidoreductase delta subunit
MDKDYNYYTYNRNNEEEIESSRNTMKLNVEIWSFNLFAYSLEKIKKCKICKAFLPDYLCENALDIIPYFSENRNNKGLIKYFFIDSLN